MHASSDRRDFIKRLSIVNLKRTLLILVMVSTGNGYSQTPQEQTTVTISDYLIAIDSLEANQGAYSAELSDLFMGLGKSYVIQQEYDDANLAFQRGMQIDRINFGLDSLSQSASRGEVFQAVKLGLLSPKNVTELGKAIQDSQLQRSSDDQLTVVDLTGVAVQDVMIAKSVFLKHQRSKNHGL